MMNIPAADWPRLFKLLDTALELDESARITWVEQLGGDEAKLKSPLLELLAQHARIETAEFLAQPAQATAAFMASGLAESQESLRPGAFVGQYKLLREIGRGGMGTVWLAERHDNFKRQVALKLPYAGPLQSQLAARFIRERDILASLTHPNIARLYDAGATESGQPFLAMEHIEGKPINEYCDERKFDIRKRIELFLQVLRAVQYAHANLVIHRDLKPNNILVTQDGQAKLLDFGIAKLVNEGELKETALTLFGGRALTPDYASPEQIAGTAISTASDVYSLGVMFFEVLAGQRPYRLKRDSRGALEDAILNAQTQRPSQAAMTADSAAARGDIGARLSKQLAGDIDVIVLTALKKSPLERYATVDAFAQDIERYLHNRPLLARADSPWYRARKFVSRNRYAVGSAAAIGIALIVGIGVAIWQADRAREQAARAQQAKRFVLSIFEDADPDSGASERTTALDLLHQASDRVNAEFKDQFETRFELQTSLAYSLIGFGENETAVAILEPLIASADTTLGADHLLTVSARNVLAEGLAGVGRNADSVKALRVALKHAEARGYHKQVVNALQWLGSRLLDEGEFEEGIASAKRAVDVADKYPDEVGGSSRAYAYQGLANVLSYTKSPGQLDAALRAYAFSKEINKGRVTPGVLTTGLSVVTAYRSEGRFADAIRECESILPQLVQILGPNHPHVATAKQYLAQSQLASGLLEPALLSYRESLRITDSIDGEAATIRRALGHLNIGAALLALRHVDQAIAELKSSRDIFSRGVGLQHPRAQLASATLALAFLYQGKVPEADNLLQSIVDAAPNDNDLLIRVNSYIADVRLRQGRLDEAVKAANDALAAGDKTSDIYAKHIALKAQGSVLLASNEPSAAVAQFETALSFIKQRNPSGSPDVAEVEQLLGSALVRAGRNQEGIVHLRAAAELWRRFDARNPGARSAAALP
jgi:serine/threonine-protein kinase